MRDPEPEGEAGLQKKGSYRTYLLRGGKFRGFGGWVGKSFGDDAGMVGGFGKIICFSGV